MQNCKVVSENVLVWDILEYNKYHKNQIKQQLFY